MPVDEVADLLAQWRDASGLFDRARVTAMAVRTIGGLSPDERRTLARAIAERGSPDLARQLEERSGGAVDAAGLTDVADRLLSLDDDEMERLITDLRDPDAVRRMARDALDEPAASPPPPASAAAGDGGSPRRASAPSGVPPPPSSQRGRSPDADAPPEPPAPPASDLAELDAAEAALARGELDGASPELGDIDLGEVELGEVELGGQALDSPDLDAPGLDDPGLEEIGLGDITLDDADVQAVAVPEASTDATSQALPDGDGRADRHADRDAAAEGVHARQRSAEAGPRGPEDVAAHEGGPGAGDGPRAGDGTDAHDGRTGTGEGSADQLRERVRGAATATSRLAAFRSVRVTDLDRAEVLAALDEVPAGWQRRRAAERLVEAGGVASDDLPGLFGRFDRDGDRAFLAGALLEVGAVTPDDLEAHVGERTLRRLATRSAR